MRWRCAWLSRGCSMTRRAPPSSAAAPARAARSATASPPPAPSCSRSSTAWPARRRLQHAVTLALERRVFARTPQIVAISRRGSEEIARHFTVPPPRLSVVYNGVDLERFHPGLRGGYREAARIEAGIPAAAFAVLFAGSGFARKGLATTIRALAQLTDSSARLLVLGRGDTAPYLRLAGELGVAERLV